MQQFAGQPEVDDDLGEGRKEGPKAKAKAKARGRPKGKAKAKAQVQKPKAKSHKPLAKAKAKAKARASKKPVGDHGDGDVLTTPKRKAPRGDVEQGSRSKKSKVAVQEQVETKGKKALKKATEAGQEQVQAKGRKAKVAKAKVAKAEVSKAKKKRASKGEAVSFARRNPPRNQRGNAEWHAIRDAYRQSLSHLHPQTENEDRFFHDIGVDILLKKHKWVLNM